MHQKTTDRIFQEIEEGLPDFISYIINTDDADWQIDIVRDKNNERNCLFGHLVNWYFGREYQGDITTAWDAFESIWSTTFEVFEINDGRDKRYQQPTPRQCCIAFLKDLWLARAEPTWRQMERDHERRSAN